MRLAGYLCFFILVVSCTGKKAPGKALDQAKMQEVMWDIIRADVLTAEYPSKDTAVDPRIANIILQKKIFQAHGISKEDFYYSFDYYTKKPEIMTVMLDTIAARKSRSRINPQIKGIKPYE